MNLSDKDILDLNELCNAVVEGTITDDQRSELSHWLITSEDARQFYVRAMSLSASMCCYAAEMQTEEPDRRIGPASPKQWRWVISLLAIAACVTLAALLARPGRSVPQIAPPVAIAPTTAPADEEFVARLTASKDLVWADPRTAVPSGGRLRRGQEIQITRGYAQITFDCGAQVLLQGPASLSANTMYSATLNRGSLRTSLPPEASGCGFSISNSKVEVVDIGTDFAMHTDANGGSAEVTVIKGEVEAVPQSLPDHPAMVLRERESKRFDNTGVATVHTSDQRLQELTKDVQLDYFERPAGYGHWSFDEMTGTAFRGYGIGLSHEVPDVEVVNPGSSAASTAVHTDGRWAGALRFDGHMYAKCGFPGIPENTPHTVAFWVNIPADVNPIDAYSMISWGATRQQFGTHQIQICWNRSPDDGPLGVLRTDYGGGHAIGLTPLRDGKWHHVAVVFIPRDDPERPMEVKQYLDGRLEGEGKPSAPGSEIFKSTAADATKITNGTVWLGCRIGPKGVRLDRFTGAIDELYIADRALIPQDIVRLMMSNQMGP